MVIESSLIRAGSGLLQGNNPLDIAKDFVSNIPLVGGFLRGLFGGAPPPPPGGIWLAQNTAAINLVATKDFKY
jgi:hypothetical protein